MNTISKESLPTRESLLGRLKDWDDQRSWQDFNDTYKPLIYAVALKGSNRMSCSRGMPFLRVSALTTGRKG